jgi:hypothetical protein
MTKKGKPIALVNVPIVMKRRKKKGKERVQYA